MQYIDVKNKEKVLKNIFGENIPNTGDYDDWEVILLSTLSKFNSHGLFKTNWKEKCVKQSSDWLDFLDSLNCLDVQIEKAKFKKNNIYYIHTPYDVNKPHKQYDDIKNDIESFQNFFNQLQYSIK